MAIIYRRVPLSDTLNFRDLGGYAAKSGGVTRWNVFFRSACPNSLNAQDALLLKNMGVTTVIDLRGGGNVDETQGGFEVLNGLTVHNVPIGGGAVPKLAVDCPADYLRIAEHPNMRKVFVALSEAQGAAIFHCFAGKDRTGVTAAILLMLAEVSDADIIADYTLTYAYFLKRLREDFSRGDAEPNVFKPLPDHIEGFMKLFREKYGTANNYLLQIGLTQQQINNILKKFV